MAENLCEKCDRRRKGNICSAHQFVPMNARKLANGELVVYCPMFLGGQRRALTEGK